MSDRLEIQDLLARYSHAIDRRDFAALARIFTPDAHIDYTAMGGAKGSFKEIQSWLEIALKPFKLFQHLVATTELTLGENTATARTICHNPMVIVQNGQDHVMLCGLWYRDEFRRTEQGWRITSRIEEHGYFYNIPPGLKPAPALEATP